MSKWLDRRLLTQKTRFKRVLGGKMYGLLQNTSSPLESLYFGFQENRQLRAIRKPMVNSERLVAVTSPFKPHA